MGESERRSNWRRRAASIRHALRTHAAREGRKACKCAHCNSNREILRWLAEQLRNLAKITLIAGGLTRYSIMRKMIDEATRHALRNFTEACDTLKRVCAGEQSATDHEKTMSDLYLIRDVLAILSKERRWKTRFKLATNGKGTS